MRRCHCHFGKQDPCSLRSGDRLAATKGPARAPFALVLEFAGWHALCSKKRTMSPKARYPLLFSVLSVIASLLSVTGETQAQSIDLSGNTFNIIRDEPRSSGERPNWLNREDCFDGADYIDAEGDNLGDHTWVHIEPLINDLPTGDSSVNLEIWVSQTDDCANDEVRQRQGSNCTLVARKRATKRIESIYVNPRDVVKQTGQKRWTEENSPPDTRVCQDSETEIGITYQVLLFRGMDVIASANWDSAGIDTLAPPAPDSVTGAPGDTHVFLEWDIPTEDEQTDTAGFGIYCVPSGTMDDGMGGASGDGAGGVGGAAAADPQCGQNVLIEGALPPDPEYLCGKTTGRGARKGQGDGLTNDVTYAVGVASRDTVFNDGRISEVLCLTPKEVTTFFEAYKNAGGEGGGGLCGISRSRNLSLWFLVVLCLCGGELRRRASGRRTRGNT